jgi:hypothetical protein
MIIGENSFDGLYWGKDVDAEVERYMMQLYNYTDGKPYHKERTVKQRIKIPDGYDIPFYTYLKDGTRISSAAMDALTPEKRKEIIEFWKEEHNKMVKGDGELCGLQYGYFNYGKLFGGKAKRPDYRRNDNAFFKLVSACIYGDNKEFRGYLGKGIIEIGRRRSGKSSKIGFLLTHLTRTLREVSLIVTSKTEYDAQHVLVNQKFYHTIEFLPLPLRPKIANKSKEQVHVGWKTKDELGNTVIKGRNVFVSGKTPKSIAIEGDTLFAWIHDEGPKTENLMQLFLNTVEALNDAEGFDRDGFVYLTGVAGDFGKHGDDYIRIWRSAKTYDLVRWFSPGWYGMNADKYGNENIEKAVRRILTDRHSHWKNNATTTAEKEYAIMQDMQKFPLTVQESLMTVGDTMFNLMRIEEQINWMRHANPIYYSGKLRWVIKGHVADWHPEQGGNCVWLELPQVGENYVLGADAIGIKSTKAGSKGVTWVWKMRSDNLSPQEKEFALMDLANESDPHMRIRAMIKMGHLPVGMLSFNHEHPKEYADNIAMLSKYVRKAAAMQPECLVLCETEPSNVIDHLNDKYPTIVAFQPIRPDKPLTVAELSKKGIIMKGYWAEKRRSELADYINKYCQLLLWTRLLNNLRNYDDQDPNKKHDDVDALGIVLIFITDPRLKIMFEKKIIKEDDQRTYLLSSYRRD